MDDSLAELPNHLALLIRSKEDNTQTYTSLSDYHSNNHQALIDHPHECCTLNFIWGNSNEIGPITIIRFSSYDYLKREALRIAETPRFMRFYMVNTQYADARWWLDVIVRDPKNKVYIEFDKAPQPED